MVYSKNELASYRLSKAKEDLFSSRELLKNDLFAQSINRSYYAVFHATRSLLAIDGYDSKKHSGVIHFFNQNYIAPQKIEKEYGKILVIAFNIRVRADYHDFFIASRSDAETQIKNAEKFLLMIENYLKNVLEK
jgi:hypothetical protein